MRKLILVLGLILFSPFATPAKALTAHTTDGFLVYTWVWVAFPGQTPPGHWVLIDAQPL